VKQVRRSPCHSCSGILFGDSRVETYTMANDYLRDGGFMDGDIVEVERTLQQKFSALAAEWGSKLTS